MGYGKSKPGMFKMKHQGVPALLKALVGDQNKLPEHLKEAIKNAPAKKEPMSEAEKNKKAREASDFRRGKGRIKVTSQRGGDKLASGTGETERRLGEGVGEINSKVAGSAGARYAGKGKPGDPKVAVVREKEASVIKPKGRNTKNAKPKVKAKPASRRALGLKEETVNKIKKKGVQTVARLGKNK